MKIIRKKYLITFYLVITSFTAFSDSLNALNSRANLPFVSQSILDSIDANSDSSAVMLEARRILVELNQVSSQYFIDLDRLFFFSYYRRINSQKIKDLGKSFDQLCQENLQNLEIRSFKYPLEKAFLRWQELHKSYDFYVGYFF